MIIDSVRGAGISMALRKAIKRSDALTILARHIRHFVKRQMYARKWTDATKAYLATHQVRKLEIGARVASLDGWLSTDVNPVSGATVFLDATKPFPFECGTFDYIYCEHMIEHISWQNGQTMLRECHRVLKPQGVMRIATPDLEVIVGLYSPTLSAEQKNYVEWMVHKELPEVSTQKAAFVINNAFRNWGHQFIYDGNLMTLALERCGFIDIRRCPYGESNEEHLRQIETHGKHIGDERIARFESMIFEGTRPAGPTAAGRESPNATVVWKHGSLDRGAARASLGDRPLAADILENKRGGAGDAWEKSVKMAGCRFRWLVPGDNGHS